MNIYDIAKLAGVSYATVSRVINHNSNVKEETRIRVQKILDENDYLPNSFARGLAKSNMKMIGILVVDVRNIHHSNIAFHIEKEFSKLGYTSIICGCGEDPDKQEDYLRIMAGRNVDGLVLIGSRFQNDVTKDSIKKYFSKKPVVIANGFLNLENVCGVILDERKAVSNVVDYLASKGHRNIAFVNGAETPSSKEKENGFLDGIRTNDLMFNTDNIVHFKQDYSISENETLNLLSNNGSITAIIYVEDLMAVGGVKACQKLNLRIPEDISIVGFNNSAYSEISTPSISSIDNKNHDVGEKCTSVLYSMLHGEKVASIYKFMPKLVLKESTN